MPEFKNKEEYEAWKAQRVIELKKKQILRQAQDDNGTADLKESIESPIQKDSGQAGMTKVIASSKAYIKNQGSFIGSGCLIQGIGLVLFAGSFLMFPIGPLLGVLVLIGFFIWGSNKSRKLFCSQCGNPVDNKKVKLCPACRVEF